MALAILMAALALSSTDRPIIAIWAQPASSTAKGCGGDCEYIAASYVKWVEMAGGRAVAMPYNASEEVTTEIFNEVNGILFTGGGAALPVSAKKLFQKISAANNAGDHFPVWGTCLGFQWTMELVAESTSVLHSGFDSENISLALDLTAQATTARMLGGSGAYGNTIRGILSNTSNPPTMNNHHQGVEPSTFSSNEKLTSFFDVLATNVDRKGRAFISQAEGKTQPVYATQWHPEKNNFEWGLNTDGLPLEAINHSPPAIKASQAMADFFLAEARKNSHSFNNPTKEWDSLVWNTGTLDTIENKGFSQVYYFHF